MPSVLVIVDARNWAFDKIYHGLKKHCQKWSIDARYGNRVSNLRDHENYDLIFYLSDYQPQVVQRANVPQHKMLMGIRSQVLEKGLPFYSNQRLMASKVRAFLVANPFLEKQFQALHPKVYLAPGGTNTDVFTRHPVNQRATPVVGWAGSRDNFGAHYRGLSIVEEACQLAGMTFRPALREDKWRGEQEMRSYYQDEIDIYVDLSLGAGRQNGLVEAGACGCPLISTRVGVAEQLIVPGSNGMLVERNASELAEALKKCSKNLSAWGENAAQEVHKNWSWKQQATIFEGIFDVCVKR